MKRDWMFLGCIAAIALIAVLRVASTHRVFSATLDEPIHLASGFEWLRGEYALDVTHPPLARILCALPLRLAGFPAPQRTNMIDEGNQLLYHGNFYERTLARARRGNLVLLVLATFAVALWARRHFSRITAAIAAAIFTNVPAVLAHAGLITTDLSIAATLPLALLALDLFLESPSTRRAIFLGIAIGLGALSKLTFFLYFPACVVVMLAVRWRPQLRWRAVALALVVAFVIVWAGYHFDLGRPADVTKDVAATFEAVGIPRALAFTPMPAPAIPVGFAQVKLHDLAGHTAYLLGRTSRHGWWYYFPVVFFFKTPIPFLLLMAWGIALAVRARKRLELVLMPLAMFVAVMPASLNIGLRYLLPVYVFLSIVAAYGASEIWRRARDSFSRAALAGALAWMFIGAAAAHPDYVACFSELAPVPSRIAVDSNLDWGQDTLRLAREVKARKIDFLWTVYSTNADMERHGIRFRTLDPGKRTPGWIAVGETPIRLSERYGGYEWMSLYKPVAQVGKTIRLYRIPAEY